MLRFEEKVRWYQRPMVRVAFVIICIGVFLGVSGCYVMQPCDAQEDAQQSVVAPDKLRVHVTKMCTDFHPRSYKFVRNLDACADYISEHFKVAGGGVSVQEFKVRGATYKNVIASFGPVGGEVLVVGAHYDSFQKTPGADDNASGVAGLLELASLLGEESRLSKEVRLVAFTLEEPPFFRTPDMGSARYVKLLQEESADVMAMICLEMIGYFTDEKGTQQFPSFLLKLFYPSTGNFIGVIGSSNDRPLIKEVKASMKGASDLPVYSMCAPEGMAMIDFSDHLNFWAADITSVMITDTAFFRNHSYHHASDTIDRLDFDRMAEVVEGVYAAVMMLAK